MMAPKFCHHHHKISMRISHSQVDQGNLPWQHKKKVWSYDHDPNQYPDHDDDIFAFEAARWNKCMHRAICSLPTCSDSVVEGTLDELSPLLETCSADEALPLAPLSETCCPADEVLVSLIHLSGFPPSSEP